MSVSMALLVAFLNISPQECMKQCEEIKKKNVPTVCPSGMDSRSCQRMRDNPPYKQCLDACAKLK